MGMVENFVAYLPSQPLRRPRAGVVGEGTPQGAILPQGPREATPQETQGALGAGGNLRGGEVREARGGQLQGSPQGLRRDQGRQEDQRRESP